MTDDPEDIDPDDLNETDDPDDPGESDDSDYIVNSKYFDNFDGIFL